MEEYAIHTSTFQLSQPKERNKWQMHYGDLVLCPSVDASTNWFHRKMMSLCFGVTWSKHESGK